MARFALVALVLVGFLALAPAPVKADAPPGQPPLAGFSLDVFQVFLGPDNQCTCVGRVSNWPAGTEVYVQLFGLLGAEVDCDEFGCFSHTVQLPPNTKGTVGCYGIATNGFWSIFTEIEYDTVG